LAVAPVGSVLPAVAVGGDFEAVADFAWAGAAAAGAAAAGADAAAAGAAAAGAVAVDAAAGLLFEAFCTPPWPLHVPLPLEVEVVPSLQVVVAPDDAGVAGAAAAGAAGAAAAGAAGAAPAFCTPPWPLHVPFPVEVEVVPSLQVVAAVESAAQAGTDQANTIKGAAMSPTRCVLFMNVHSLVRFEFSGEF
jgi:hypothetical protein